MDLSRLSMLRWNIAAAELMPNGYRLYTKRPRCVLMVVSSFDSSNALPPTYVNSGHLGNFGQLIVTPVLLWPTYAATRENPCGKLKKSAQVKCNRCPDSSSSRKGIPSSFCTKADLTKYLTIFTCSGQHAAVNSRQLRINMTVTYHVMLTTEESILAGTVDNVFVSLVGSLGKSEKVQVGTLSQIVPGNSTSIKIENESDLGEILLVKLYKDKHLLLPQDSWYSQNVIVEAPNKQVFTFPCHTWITDLEPVAVMEGTARKKHEYESAILEQHWTDEISKRQAAYQWNIFAPGIPKCINAESSNYLPNDAQFTIGRKLDIIFSIDPSMVELGLNLVKDMEEIWDNLDEIYKPWDRSSIPVAEYVEQHWKKDTFFGYQYLNGSNPVLIKQCTAIPSNFPVTDEMVSTSFGPSTSLQHELQKGNIFIVDYEMLDGIPANKICGYQQFLGAPMCLLYSNPDMELIPIAIQIKQEPGPQNPIFLPNDSKYDWCLAKIWVRNADFQIYELVSHLLKTHLFAEVFYIATLRKLPTAHPIFKLLMPHLKFTLDINTEARNLLISKGGIFDQVFSTGGKAKVLILQRALERTTYTSLCLPEDLAFRGVEKLPNYYYRDDALKIWFAINRFVESIVDVYYKNDASIQDDTETQEWAKEIFTEGFLARKSSGIPSSFYTKADLTKYLTMVIFTCSGQHAAVNSGQFDFGAWMPNNPSTMQNPPPTEKGAVGERDICCTLPGVCATAIVLATIHLLSKTSPSSTKLGRYVEERFTEAAPKACIEKFQADLLQVGREIEKRNESLELKYEYLLPNLIENSVSI
uniref:polyunsaturated fatty acid lipoxygenase ALOX15B-like n=1 Tax=Pristiophorus japonicus TaxID=55135 RepID=UPI00398F5D57